MLKMEKPVCKMGECHSRSVTISFCRRVKSLLFASVFQASKCAMLSDDVFYLIVPYINPYYHLKNSLCFFGFPILNITTEIFKTFIDPIAAPA